MDVIDTVEMSMYKQYASFHFHCAKLVGQNFDIAMQCKDHKLKVRS